MNNIKCFECHNLGHVVARCRRKMVQDHHIPGTLMDISFLAICLVTKLLIATKGI